MLWRGRGVSGGGGGAGVDVEGSRGGGDSRPASSSPDTAACGRRGEGEIGITPTTGWAGSDEAASCSLCVRPLHTTQERRSITSEGPAPAVSKPWAEPLWNMWWKLPAAPPVLRTRLGCATSASAADCSCWRTCARGYATLLGVGDPVGVVSALLDPAEVGHRRGRQRRRAPLDQARSARRHVCVPGDPRRRRHRNERQPGVGGGGFDAIVDTRRTSHPWRRLRKRVAVSHLARIHPTPAAN